MAKTAKKVLIGFGLLAGILILLVIAFLIFFDVNAYKPRIEAAASNASGMNVTIGKINLALFPRPVIVLNKIAVDNSGTNVASIERMLLAPQILPLFKHQIFVTDFRLEKPVILIQRNKNGKFNFERPSPNKPNEPASRTPFATRIDTLAVSHADVTYHDLSSGDQVTIQNADVNLKGLSIAGSDTENPVKGISVSGTFDCDTLKMKQIDVTRIAGTFRATQGKIDINPLTMKVAGGDGSGTVQADLSSKTPQFTIRYGLSHVRVENLSAMFAQRTLVEGPVDITTQLSFRGSGAPEIKKTLRGDITLKGKDLATAYDIDSINTLLEQKRFNLKDTGAFLLLGPLSSSLSSKPDLERGRAESGGRKGTITNLVAVWAVNNGIADAKDVALSTRKNRIAIKGGLDLVRNRFVNTTVALLDEKGCARVSQEVNGSFQAPQVSTQKTIESLIQPFLKRFKGAEKFLQTRECTPFYTGSVSPPK